MQSKVVLNHTSLQKLAKYRKDVKEDYGWLTGRQAEVHNAKGLERFINQDYTKSVGSFTRAINLNPHEPTYYYHRAESYLKLKDYLNAIENFNQVVTMLREAPIRYTSEGVEYGLVNLWDWDVDKFASNNTFFDVVAAAILGNEEGVGVGGSGSHVGSTNLQQQQQQSSTSNNNEISNVEAIGSKDETPTETVSQEPAGIALTMESKPDLQVPEKPVSKPQTLEQPLNQSTQQQQQSSPKTIVDPSSPVYLPLTIPLIPSPSNPALRYAELRLFYAYYEYALDLSKQGKVEESLRCVGKAEEFQYHLKYVHYLKIALYIQQNDNKRAQELITNVLTREPENANLYVLRAQLNREIDNFNQVNRDYIRAHSLYPKHPGLPSLRLYLNEISVGYKNLASGAIMSDRRDLALAILSKVIELESDDWISYLKRGLLFADKGDYANSIHDFCEVLKLECRDTTRDPEVKTYLADAYNKYGVHLYEKGNYQIAYLNFCGAVDMNPDEAILFKNRADAAFMLGATEQAVKDYFKALELDSSDERIRQSCASIFFERGDALYARGEFMEAIYQITDAIALYPTSHAYFTRGRCYLALKNGKAAREDFVLCMKLEPNHKLAEQFINEIDGIPNSAHKHHPAQQQPRPQPRTTAKNNNDSTQNTNMPTLPLILDKMLGKGNTELMAKQRLQEIDVLQKEPVYTLSALPPSKLVKKLDLWIPPQLETIIRIEQNKVKMNKKKQFVLPPLPTRIPATLDVDNKDEGDESTLASTESLT